MGKSPIIIVPKYAKVGTGFSRKEKAEALFHPGRQADPKKGYQSPAAWVGDLADIKLSIILCSFCRSRFNFRKSRYRKKYTPDWTGKSDPYTVNGICDACKQHTTNMGGGTLYIHEEFWEKLSDDPMKARRRAREKWRRYDELSKIGKS